MAVADVSAYREIHRIGTRFTKAPWYQNLSPKQYDDETCAVFGLRNHAKVHARRKLFLQAATPSALKEWEPSVKELVDKTIGKIGQDLAEHGVTDIMKWFTHMTTDVLGMIAFGQDFAMVQTGTVSYSSLHGL